MACLACLMFFPDLGFIGEPSRTSNVPTNPRKGSGATFTSFEVHSSPASSPSDRRCGGKQLLIPDYFYESSWVTQLPSSCGAKFSQL